MAEGTAAGSWARYVAAAHGQGNEGEVLAEACLAHSRFIPASTFSTRVGGVPAGRPDRALARAVAARMLELHPKPVPGTDGIQRILGLLTLGTAPAPGTDAAELDSALTAVGEAEVGGDLDVIDFALATTARRAWSLRDSESVEFFATRVVESHDPASVPSYPWTVATSAGSPRWLPEAWVTRAVIATDAAAMLTDSATALADFERRTKAVATRTKFAETIRTERPRLYAKAIVSELALARALGDRPSFRHHELRLAALAEADGPERGATRALIQTRTATADSQGNWTLMEALQRQRLEIVLAAVREQAEVEVPLETVAQVISHLVGIGDRSYVTAMGNAYLSIVVARYRMGRTRTDPAERNEALKLLDLADTAYRGVGNSGISSVERYRALILHEAGLISLDELVASLLDNSKAARAAISRALTVLDAARLCRAGDTRVRERVLEGLSGPVSTNTPRYRAAWAIWLFRAAEEASEEILVPGWDQALEEASRAGHELVVGGRLVNPLLSLEMWEVAWRAHVGLHGDDGDLGVRMVLALAAVNALATQLVILTESVDRTRISAEHGQLFAEAAALAVRLGDPVSAELVMEAARRERVGLLLGELAHNPKVGEVVREAAAGILVANAATPEEGSFPDGQRALAWQARSADAIQSSRRAAVEAASSVIGPAAALADLSRAQVPVAATLARETAGVGSTAAVLQLYRPASDPGTVFWAIEASDGTSECGRAELPVPLPRIEEAGFWTSMYNARVGEALVPAPLRRLLLEHAGAATGPVRLTVVPSGLLGIPFDQIDLGGSFLLECADVVLTGSLTMARALHDATAAHGDTASGWLSVYDHTRLTHTRAESEALAASHAPVEEVGGRDALFAALSPDASRPGLVAMGLHGSGDETGWAQAKLLPDGTTVLAAEALAWQAPPVAVLSSCHSRLETLDGTELSGFPAAFLLRGSTTVIGSLTTIDDEATAGIITRFWHHSAAGHSPAHALAQAKRDWIRHDPRRWGEQRLWAPLVAYGTHAA